MLAHMFSDVLPASCLDKDGNFAIDRDGESFRYILNYLRDGSCVLPVPYHTRAELLREADYYQVRCTVLRAQHTSMAKLARNIL